MRQKKPKIIVHYFPQFHPIPENDFHWGKGFTDWDNVKNAKPLYKGHYQPRIPLNKDYYDPRNINTLKNQVDLALKYHIDGFCFYHYWFDGKLVLEKPMEVFLQDKSLNIDFCISWANETWTKRWIGQSNTVILKQTHKPDTQIWENHFNYLLRFFKDNRYIKVDNKPVFLIYQPGIIKKLDEMLTFWNELAQKNGFNGICFVATKRHNFINFNLDNFDFIYDFQPMNSYNSDDFDEKRFFSKNAFQRLRFMPESIINFLHSIRIKFERKNKIYDSNKIWDIILNNSKNDTNINNKTKTIHGAFVNLDNTPRYGDKATLFSHVEPEEFGNYLSKLYQSESEKESPFIFINAWNEWSESAYLEPDEKYQFAYLEALQNAIKQPFEM